MIGNFKFLNDYNGIMALYQVRLDKLAQESDMDNNPKCIAARKEAADNMGVTVERFQEVVEEFWSKQKPSKNGLWEIRILMWFLFKKIDIVSYVSTHTSWRLPNGYKLTYTDYCHSWSLDANDSVIDPKTLVNSVYCKKGLLYKLLCNLMRKKAAEYREIFDWKELDTFSRNAKNYLEPMRG